MSHSAHRVTEIKNPGNLRDISCLRGWALGMFATGMAAFAIQYIFDPQLAWASYLEGFFYALLLALSGAFFVSVNYITKSVWHVPVRRVAEAMTSFLPWTLIFILPVFFNLDVIYEWTDHHAAHLHGTKAYYLTPGFWIVRILFFLILWVLYTSSFRRQSLAQDEHRQKLSMVGVSARYLILFGFTFTVFSVDFLMSIRPHWFSTMYGVYCFAGMYQAGLCVMILTLLYLRDKGYIEGIFLERHLMDISTWLLAWCTFMCYIGFSQFMLIWYANLPEETPFFIDHLYGEWKYLYILVFLVKWAIPFCVLMPKPCRRNPMVLRIMCVAILLIEWVDIHWLVTPEFLDESVKHIAFNGHFVLSFLVGMGFLGLFALSFFKFLNRNNVVAVGEPDLLSSVNGDYL
jgi:hypothetical protein